MPAEDAAADHSASSPRAVNGSEYEYECELLLTTATTTATTKASKEESQTKTTQQPRRRGSFLEEINLDDFDGLDDDDDQFVDIEQDVARPPPSTTLDRGLSSPPRQTRRVVAAEAAAGVDDTCRPNDATSASSTKIDVSSGQSAESYYLPPNRTHSLMSLNDVPTEENDHGGRLPRRISFECHSSALLEGMVAGGEFADVFHSDSDSSSDASSDASSVSSGMTDTTGSGRNMPRQCRRRPSASSPALARLGPPNKNNGTAAAVPPTVIRRSASTLGLRSSSSMISLASICEDANVRDAPSLVSKVDRYIVNREIKLGSSIVRTQSELAMARMAQEGQDQMGLGPEGMDAANTSMPVSTTFTRRGRRRSSRSYASTNDLPSAAATSA